MIQKLDTVETLIESKCRKYLEILQQQFLSYMNKLTWRGRNLPLSLLLDGAGLNYCHHHI